MDVLRPLLDPANLLLGLLLLGLAAQLTPWGRAGRGILTMASLVLAAIALSPTAALLLGPLESRFPAPEAAPARVDGIIVLGGAVEPALSSRHGQLVVNDNAERLLAAADLARRHPAAQLVFSGGDPAGKGVSEADVAARLLGTLGVPPDRLLVEATARSTWENAQALDRLVQRGPDEAWLLVTSARHMPRAVGCFRRLGWPVVPWPVDYRSSGELGLRFDLSGGLLGLKEGVREWLALAFYRSAGRTDALFPGPVLADRAD